MEERVKEAVRYLGYGRHDADEKTLNLITDAFSELEAVSEKRMTYRIFEMSVAEDESIIIENMKIHSKNLSKNLKGCEQVILLGATLGIKVDLLMKRYSYTDMARVVVLQACAAAMLEEYLDERQMKLSKEMEKEGFYLRPRFSPGYGDFSILHQKDILSMTDAAKKIGLTMTDSSMLTPVKSVTALIGLSRKKENCHIKGCEACEKRDCKYRRS
ncbi:MAG: Vitamin B12 dependent methionine synthase activation subunit [Lachnospiraceae bacterium]